MSWGQSMRHIIVPQATKHILPALVNECIQVLKETAIAGYIALDDLTRMGNIIRSRTFDAYTPFIVVAIIYFYTTTIPVSYTHLTPLGLERRKSIWNIKRAALK